VEIQWKKWGLFVAVLVVCCGVGYVIADLSLFYQAVWGLIVIVVGSIILESQANTELRDISE
jgi:uncharacterized membrane protein